jgi:hypothetical protein
MAYVLTADQIDSRRHGDLVDATLRELATVHTRRPFLRTVGDELQGLLDRPASVVDAILILMRAEQWHIGLGLGPVTEPVPAETRSARGPAFLCARSAVEEAKSEPSHLRLIAVREVAYETTDAEAVFRLLAAVRSRRTPSGWQAVDLAREGQTHAQISAALGISRQAVGQRLQAAHWAVEEATIPTLGRLLARAEREASR